MDRANKSFYVVIVRNHRKNKIFRQLFFNCSGWLRCISSRWIRAKKNSSLVKSNRCRRILLPIFKKSVCDKLVVCIQVGCCELNVFIILICIFTKGVLPSAARSCWAAAGFEVLHEVRQRTV